LCLYFLLLVKPRAVTRRRRFLKKKELDSDSRKGLSIPFCEINLYKLLTEPTKVVKFTDKVAFGAYANENTKAVAEQDFSNGLGASAEVRAGSLGDSGASVDFSKDGVKAQMDGKVLKSEVQTAVKAGSKGVETKFVSKNFPLVDDTKVEGALGSDRVALKAEAAVTQTFDATCRKGEGLVTLLENFQPVRRTVDSKFLSAFEKFWY